MKRIGALSIASTRKRRKCRIENTEWKKKEKRRGRQKMNKEKTEKLQSGDRWSKLYFDLSYPFTLLPSSSSSLPSSSFCFVLSPSQGAAAGKNILELTDSVTVHLHTRATQVERQRERERGGQKKERESLDSVVSTLHVFPYFFSLTLFFLLISYFSPSQRDWMLHLHLKCRFWFQTKSRQKNTRSKKNRDTDERREERRCVFVCAVESVTFFMRDSENKTHGQEEMKKKVDLMLGDERHSSVWWPSKRHSWSRRVRVFFVSERHASGS